MDDVAVAAGARARVAENHERGGAVVPALADVRTIGLFAHGVQAEAAHDPLQAEVVFRPGRADLQPVRFGLPRQLVRAFLSAANEIEGSSRQPLNFILARMAGLSITWFGHATFVLTSPGGKRIVTDPWLEGNPKEPAGAKIDKADVICVSHGHSDHTTDVVPIARATGAPVVAIYELATYFQGKGLKEVIGMNMGGTVDVKGLKITMTPAIHSSGITEDGKSIYLGEPAGFVIRLEDG